MSNTTSFRDLQSLLLQADSRGDAAERTRIVAEMNARIESTIDKRDPSTIAADDFRASAIEELKGAKAHADYLARTPLHPNTRRAVDNVSAGRLARAETVVRGLGIDPATVQA